MIIKTQKMYRKRVRLGTEAHNETIIKTTYWLLFIPIYIQNEIQSSSL